MQLAAAQLAAALAPVPLCARVCFCVRTCVLCICIVICPCICHCPCHTLCMCMLGSVHAWHGRSRQLSALAVAAPLACKTRSACSHVRSALRPPPRCRARPSKAPGWTCASSHTPGLKSTAPTPLCEALIPRGARRTQRVLCDAVGGLGLPGTRLVLLMAPAPTRPPRPSASHRSARPHPSAQPPRAAAPTPTHARTPRARPRRTASLGQFTLGDLASGSLELSAGPNFAIQHTSGNRVALLSKDQAALRMRSWMANTRPRVAFSGMTQDGRAVTALIRLTAMTVTPSEPGPRARGAAAVGCTGGALAMRRSRSCGCSCSVSCLPLVEPLRLSCVSRRAQAKQACPIYQSGLGSCNAPPAVLEHPRNLRKPNQTNPKPLPLAEGFAIKFETNSSIIKPDPKASIAAGGRRLAQSSTVVTVATLTSYCSGCVQLPSVGTGAWGHRKRGAAPGPPRRRASEAPSQWTCVRVCLSADGPGIWRGGVGTEKRTDAGCKQTASLPMAGVHTGSRLTSARSSCPPSPHTGYNANTGERSRREHNAARAGTAEAGSRELPPVGGAKATRSASLTLRVWMGERRPQARGRARPRVARRMPAARLRGLRGC